MIYIFDDRPERRNKYDLVVAELSHYVTREVITCGTVEELISFIRVQLKNVTHVLLHVSYIYSGDELDTSKVVETFYSFSKDIQIVLFSGGYDHPGISMIGKARVYNINSDIMYNNLVLFTHQLAKNPKSPIEILLWGKSYLQNQILATKSAVFRLLINTEWDKQIDVEDEKDELRLDEIKETISDKLRNDELSGLREGLKAILVPQKTWHKLLEDFEDVITKTNIL